MVLALRSFGATVAVALTMLASGSVVAAERVLLDKSGYIERSKEATVLDAKGLKHIELWRTLYLSVHLVAMDLSALKESGTVVVTMPDSIPHPFAGTKTDSTPRGSFTWYSPPPRNLSVRALVAWRS